MKQHKQVKIRHKEMGLIEVDEGIAELIEEIWKHDIWTDNSCQENKPGIVWINITQGLKKFLDIVSDRFPKNTGSVFNNLYSRVLGYEPDGSFSKQQKFGWKYDLHVQDFNDGMTIDNDEVKYNPTGPSDMRFSVSVRFPISDMPLIIERLKKW